MKQLYLYDGTLSDAMQLAGAQRIRIETTIINKMFMANGAFKAMLEQMPSVSNAHIERCLETVELSPSDVSSVGEALHLTREGRAKIARQILEMLDITSDDLWQGVIKTTDESVIPSVVDGDSAKDTPDSTTGKSAPVAFVIPDQNDKQANEAFEAWAISQKMDMSCHPMHWLFLNPSTNGARQGWKAALAYVGKLNAQPQPSIEQEPEAN